MYFIVIIMIIAGSPGTKRPSLYSHLPPILQGTKKKADVSSLGSLLASHHGV